MKRLLLLIVLAGCDGSAGPDPAAQPVTAPSVEAGQAAVASPAEQAAIHAQKAKQALGAILIDPGSARYSEVRAGAAGAVCGRVDAKQADGRFGGPRPFVVTPEGVGVVSTKPEIMFEDPEDIFPDFYIRWCATPEELRRIGPRIAAGSALQAPLPEVPAALPDTAPLPAGAPGAATEQAAPQAPPPKDEDSFSRAVLRNGSDGAARPD